MCSENCVMKHQLFEKQNIYCVCVAAEKKGIHTLHCKNLGFSNDMGEALRVEEKARVSATLLLEELQTNELKSQDQTAMHINEKDLRCELLLEQSFSIKSSSSSTHHKIRCECHIFLQLLVLQEIVGEFKANRSFQYTQQASSALLCVYHCHRRTSLWGGVGV